MHSSGKGKSGSTKPIKKISPWVRYKEKEIEKLIVKSAKAGKTASEIGMILRDTYGINNIRASSGKKITQILASNELLKKLPEDMTALIKKYQDVKKHWEKNHHDQTAKRGLQLTESKIRRLAKYYKKSKKLPLSWKFQTDNVGIYLE